MSEISDNNLIPIPLSNLKAGQRLEKRTAADGSTIYIAQGIGSFVSGGKVFVEAQTTFTDDTSTEVTLPLMAANRRYVYTQPLTRLDIEAIADSSLESEVRFIAGTNVVVTLPATVGLVNQMQFVAGLRYIICVKDNTAVITTYSVGEDAI